MRKLDKEHLTHLIMFFITLLSIWFIPYFMSYVSVWILKASNFNVSELIEWISAYPIPTPTDSPTIFLYRWSNGIIKVFWLVAVCGGIYILWCISYTLFDWLFPRVDNKDTKDKT